MPAHLGVPAAMRHPVAQGLGGARVGGAIHQDEGAGKAAKGGAQVCGLLAAADVPQADGGGVARHTRLQQQEAGALGAAAADSAAPRLLLACKRVGQRRGIQPTGEERRARGEGLG